MRKVPFIIGILILVLLVAFLTNPSEEKHKEKVQAVVAGNFEKADNAVNANEYEEARKALREVVVKQLVDDVKSSDYLFFSTTNIPYNDGLHTIGVGAFGNVFVFSAAKDALAKGFWEQQ